MLFVIKHKTEKYILNQKKHPVGICFTRKIVEKQKAFKVKITLLK